MGVNIVGDPEPEFKPNTLEENQMIPLDSLLAAGRFMLAKTGVWDVPMEPQRWLVEGFVPTGAVCMLVGDAGSKKTYAMLDMGLNVAAGRPWLGRRVVQTNVLYLDEESGRERLRLRGRQLGLGHGLPNSLPMYATFYAQWNFRSTMDADYLTRLIHDWQTGLVVVDALAEVMPGADENKVRDTVEVFGNLRRVADKTGAAILLIHHANKQGLYRGSSHLKAAVDVMWMVESDPRSAWMAFESIKTRDTGPKRFAARLLLEPQGDAPERARLEAADWADEARARQVGAGQRLTRAGQYVVDYLKQNGPSKRTDLHAKRGLHSVSAVDKALNALKSEGVIKRVNRGGRGIAAVYGVAEEVLED